MQHFAKLRLVQMNCNLESPGVLIGKAQAHLFFCLKSFRDVLTLLHPVTCVFPQLPSHIPIFSLPTLHTQGGS